MTSRSGVTTGSPGRRSRRRADRSDVRRSPPDGGPGVVFGFIGGDEARGFAKLHRSSAAQAVLDKFVTFFGHRRRSRSSTSRRLEARDVDPRLPGRDPRTGPVARLRRPRCASRSAASTGPGPRRRLLERLHGRRGALRRACRRRDLRAAVTVRRLGVPWLVATALIALVAVAPAQSAHSTAPRARFDTRVFALIPTPGFPARTYVAPNHRVYEGTYTNPGGDSVPSRVLPTRATAAARLVDDLRPGPRCRAWRPGRDQRQPRPAGAARQGARPRAAAQRPQRQAAHVRDLPGRGDTQLRGLGPEGRALRHRLHPR